MAREALRPLLYFAGAAARRRRVGGAALPSAAPRRRCAARHRRHRRAWARQWGVLCDSRVRRRTGSEEHRPGLGTLEHTARNVLAGVPPCSGKRRRGDAG